MRWFPNETESFGMKSGMFFFKITAGFSRLFSLTHETASPSLTQKAGNSLPPNKPKKIAAPSAWKKAREKQSCKFALSFQLLPSDPPRFP
ncbi:MAG: hypothetical protein ONB44_24395 [candidate division KSB1 bacterium]|nr:hypothetical protein [candidate division KSB1 bacterium]MDZ7305276.1 hypothetical protein [candidate division KSB1 bacterium]MDZ7313510.1 hypothetical protein [candidate division KSB1 bacterium]